MKIELLSRFRSAREQKEIAKRVESGDVDVIIGTHRLLSKDVKFKELGIVVVDEEQRFGVTHKERLKHLKKRVDVLTLSATPIPRTLNMSLSGLRDMSLIETPPRDRLAIAIEHPQCKPERPHVLAAKRLLVAKAKWLHCIKRQLRDIEVHNLPSGEAAVLERILVVSRLCEVPSGELTLVGDDQPAVAQLIERIRKVE